MKAATSRGVLLVAALYLSVGILAAELAREAASHEMVLVWRWAAWVVSGFAFGAHVIYEQVHVRSSSKITAFHVSSAAGLGAFGLAVAANVHAELVSPQQHPRFLAWSLAIWPAITVLPAFAVALVAAILLARARQSSAQSPVLPNER
jgi:hypothetical protein